MTEKLDVYYDDDFEEESEWTIIRILRNHMIIKRFNWIIIILFVFLIISLILVDQNPVISKDY